MKTIILSLAAASAIMAITPANATVSICKGGGCGPQPHSNVLVTKGATGTTINGSLNNVDDVVVSFTSGQILTMPANGQSRVQALSGSLTSPLTIGVETGLISALELNINAATSGNVFFSFTGGAADGFVSQNYSVNANGQNFFNLFDDTFRSVTISFTNGARGKDIRQVRLTSIDEPTAGVVPEPATWAMMIMGFGLTGAMMRRRKTVSTSNAA